MKEDLKAKKAQVKSWRKALAAFTPKQALQKKPTVLKGAAA
jgi:hypothetical protein